MLYPGPRRFDPFDHSVEYNNIIKELHFEKETEYIFFINLY